ncbi:MAG: GTP-binding protein, partial [Phormidesmis sp. RL_2_1]|nr:GTP-binding protein [Phormidesmis sp. RL_2_1]
RPSQNQLVFIGHQLNPLQLHQQLNNCLTSQPVSLLSV